MMNEDEGFLESCSFNIRSRSSYEDELLLCSIYTGIIASFNEVMSAITKDYRNMTPQFISQVVADKLKSIKGDQ